VIGVLAKPEQAAVVEEFFELFKTPWEPFRPGRHYDVVIATTAIVPAGPASLLLVYSAGPTSCDATYRLAAESRQPGPCQVEDAAGRSLPIYGDLATFEPSDRARPCLTAAAGTVGVRLDTSSSTVLRVGYDLFAEVEHLLTTGQPLDRAHVPTLDLHIAMLREWMLAAGVGFVEIAPAPAGHPFTVCLTHDIDFIGIRQHFFDHTMFGFLYRSTIGGLRDWMRGRLPVARVLKMWRAAVSLPFVYLGWARDFWEPFEWFLNVERPLPATYFLIPFKRRAGEHVPGRHAQRRATAYDVGDLTLRTATLLDHGCEVGVHGIDAWHSVERGEEELRRVSDVTADPGVGIRMHWLLQNAETPATLERAGYAYDSTAGYNDTIGYRNGTTQVYRPLGNHTLLELPLHSQDGALFYPQKLDLSETEAARRCGELIAHSRTGGGVLTVLWHDRSHGPERFWGEFYAGLVDTLKAERPWFATCAQLVGWFRQRRDVRFEVVESADGVRTTLRAAGEPISPPLVIRLHRPAAQGSAAPTSLDRIWDGATAADVASTRPVMVQQRAHSLS
jgi:hypothetical protein